MPAHVSEAERSGRSPIEVAAPCSTINRSTKRANGGTYRKDRVVSSSMPLCFIDFIVIPYITITETGWLRSVMSLTRSGHSFRPCFSVFINACAHATCALRALDCARMSFIAMHGLLSLAICLCHATAFAVIVNSASWQGMADYTVTKNDRSRTRSYHRLYLSPHINAESSNTRVWSRQQSSKSRGPKSWEVCVGVLHITSIPV